MAGALEDARSARGRLLLITGEPGIGKTRLADELAQRAAENDGTVFWGRCWEAGGAPAFWPWTQVLRELVRSRTDSELGGQTSELAQLLPELRQRFPDLPEPAPASPDVARFRLFDAVGEFLRGASRGGPLVVILEDLHAADAPSVLLLSFVAGLLAGARLLVVGTYRDIELRSDQPLALVLPELLRVSGALRLTLAGLDRDDIARLVQGLSGTAPTDRLVDAIHQETEGNPLFVREVVQLLASEGRLSAEVEPEHWGVPEGVRQAIRRRLDRLSANDKQTLGIVSVLGRDFTLQALAEVLQRSPIEVTEALQEPLAQRIVVEILGAPGRFRFSHSLVREVLYEQFTLGERATLHRAVADSLERIYASNPEPYLAELAHHYFHASPGLDTDKAIDYSKRAGERAIRLLAYEEAVRLFQMALARAADDETRAGLLVALGDAQSRSGQEAVARQTFLDAASLATRLAIPELLARAALGYGGRFIWLRAGTDRQVIPLLEQALAELGLQDSELRALLLARLAGALRDQPSDKRRAALSAEGVAVARRLGNPQILMSALVSRWGAATLGPDGVDEQLAMVDELDRLAAEVVDRERAVNAIWPRFIHSMTTGDVDHARQAFMQMSRLAEELHLPSSRWYAGVMQTVLALQDGDFAEGESLIPRTLEVGRHAQDLNVDAGSSALFALFLLRREQGRLQELEQDLLVAPDRYVGYRGFRCMLALAHCELGRRDEAQRVLQRLSDNDFAALPKDGEWLYSLTLLSEVAYALGDRDRGETLYRLLHPYGHLIALAGSEVSWGPVFRPLGVLATLTGRDDELDRHFNNSITMCSRMGALPWLVRSQHDYARALMRRAERKDRGKALHLLDSSLQIGLRIGMTAVVGQADEALAQFGKRSGQLFEQRSDALTQREHEVAQLIAEGLSNRQIASQLFLSERTVDTHVQNMLNKLGFTSRTQVAAWAVAAGLVRQDKQQQPHT